MVPGSCLCREVAFEVDAFDAMVHCHCSMCRKAHGSAFATIARAPRTAFRWLRGEDRIRRYVSSANGLRSFCATCGSPLPPVDDAWDQVAVSAGLLDSDCGVRPTAHMFTGSKLESYAITDTLPQFETGPGMDFTPVQRPVRGGRAGVLAGSCLCGEVTFETEAQPIGAMNCHCSRCQKSRGAAHATNLWLEPGPFRYLTGEDRLTHYRFPGATRFTATFCSRCGSQMPSPWRDLPFLVAPAGVMDDPVDVTPRANIFVADKAIWFDITDALPQFEGAPPR